MEISPCISYYVLSPVRYPNLAMSNMHIIFQHPLSYAIPHEFFGAVPPLLFGSQLNSLILMNCFTQENCKSAPKTSAPKKSLTEPALATCSFSAASKLLRISTRLRYFTYSWIFLSWGKVFSIVGTQNQRRMWFQAGSCITIELSTCHFCIPCIEQHATNNHHNMAVYTTVYGKKNTIKLALTKVCWDCCGSCWIPPENWSSDKTLCFLVQSPIFVLKSQLFVDSMVIQSYLCWFNHHHNYLLIQSYFSMVISPPFAQNFHITLWWKMSPVGHPFGQGTHLRLSSRCPGEIRNTVTHGDFCGRKNEVR